MSSKVISVGILGLGRSGWGIHVKAAGNMTDRFRVVAVHDPIAGRRQQAESEIGCRSHDTPEGVMNDDRVDMVVVSTPNALHAPMAIQAMKAGKHVLCEKPFGLTVADVDAMIAAAKKADVVLQPFQQRRYEPDFRKIMEICASGLLGEIQMAKICWHSFRRRWDWQTTTSMSGGALNNNGPHPIDHAVELFGGDDPEVWSEMRRCLCSGDAEDYLKLVLTGAGHPTVEVEVMDCIAYGQDRWLVNGTSGGLRGTATHLEWKWVDWTDMPERPLFLEPTPDRSYNREELPWQSDSWELKTEADVGAGGAPSPQPVLDLYSSLYETIVDGKPQAITPKAVRVRVAVLEKARASAKKLGGIK